MSRWPPRGRVCRHRSETKAEREPSSSTRIPAVMAIAATCVISTARSPTTWQPRILRVARSTISLQKPNVRPSMIVRVVASKWIIEATTSCAARAFASVRPTWAYSGSVKLPIGFTAVAKRHRRAADRVGRRHEAVLNRRRDQQQATGDIPGGKNVRRGRPQICIDRHEAPMIDLDACRREVQPGRVRLPADGHDRE